MEKPTVAVDILGKSFNINCPKGHEAELKEAAEYLNNQMRELRASGKAVGLEKIAIITALNITHDLLSSRRYARSNEQQLRELTSQLDSALGQQSKVG
ncbi:MAG: cell division protein ZapA [Marinomonas sp.]|jgi:cell division protein ZapA|uniref:Cell division protein ZapA n=2 Tax=Marinomonas TaxID=28253 RepID=A0A4R6X651_9GAMM|nr:MULTISPECIES: cell division protein ZapA [Marinomonas]MEC8080732.1 cell division protein ZapA [Pseudomonadota bacterium]RUM50659.1 MAG: cell division protein ZapA [Marinomonas sp.]MBJ7550823.1 cell division protein ZapA [Marinomonas ostreistagni]MCC4273355.1 cell division protein ZapA [Marinomonas communis]MEC8484286.1 cell division protein ZapA [Pseudomonadota bacterium]|tara:strand:+ start:181 stop:474 length:294 start_codon:yes stop_codon:yes gene_type:complete